MAAGLPLETQLADVRGNTDRRGPTLSAVLHGNDDASPSVHYAFPERSHIIKHLVGTIRRGDNIGRLLKHQANDLKVNLEMAADGASDIAKGLQNCRLELVT